MATDLLVGGVAVACVGAALADFHHGLAPRILFIGCVMFILGAVGV